MKLTRDEILRGYAIRRLRRERGMSMLEASWALGHDRSMVCRWERLERTPPSVRDIARAFIVPEDTVTGLCPVCAYSPPRGYMCLHCGTAVPLEQAARSRSTGGTLPGSKEEA